MPDDAALMKLMAGADAGKPGAPAEGSPPPAADGAPVGAPMMNPQENEGDKQQGYVRIALALDLLEQSLPPFGSETPEGKALMTALTHLTKAFGEQRPKGKELVPAELKTLMDSQAPSPEMQAMMRPPAPAAAPPMAA